MPWRYSVSIVAAYCIVVFTASFTAPAIAQSSAGALLDQALTGKHRTEASRLRDQYRHPKETLLFFGLEPGMSVVEIWPGGGWYTEIIGPVLRDRGKYYLAHYALEDPKLAGWQREVREKQQVKIADQAAVYGKPAFTSFGPPEHVTIAPAGSADLVLTFRNVHNWSSRNSDLAAFKAFYSALKPGGILGVVEHRAKPGTTLERMVKSGYMTEAHVITLAEQADFKLLEKTEINANPLDTTDHPDGVWTLLPMLRGWLDKDKYRAIGESDRMTLKFRKPEYAAMPVTPLYAALLGLMFIALSLRTIRLRRRYRVAIGDGRNALLQRAMRVNANFAEYVPLTVMLIYFVELHDGPRLHVHLLGITLVCGRLLHAWGVSQAQENFRYRTAGIMLTFGVMLTACLLVLLYQLE